MTSEKSLLFDVFEQTLDLVCIVDKKGWFLEVNPAVLHTLGYTKEELFSEPVSSRIHPDDRERTKESRNRLLENEPLLNFQNRYLTRDGRIIWLQWTSVYIPEKEVVFAIAKDITTKKKADLETEENFKKFKELTDHFKQFVEKDRQFFAAELHEELGQLATVIKMDLEWFSSLQFDLDPQSKKRMEQGMNTVQTLINRIRRLSYSINPSQIDDLGLDEVLRSLCREFTCITGIRSEYSGSFNEDILTREIKLDLYRICQEALSNVMKHSHATEVSVRLVQKKKKIELIVRDNGEGFDHENKQTFGLKNMRSRVASVNGEIEIRSIKTKGTRVSATVPT